MIYIIGLAAALILFLFILSIIYGRLITPAWLLFFIHCSLFKFSFKQQRKLARLITIQKIAKPAALFTYKEILKDIITNYLNSEQVDTHLLQQLFTIRIALEQKESASGNAKNALQTTKQIPLEQNFTIDTLENETYHAVLVENSNLLTMLLDTQPKHVGRHINVYFWYRGIGYAFQSMVEHREELRLSLPQTSSLLQRRKRAYQRKVANLPAEFFLAGQYQKRYTLESEGGFPCTIKDISVDGIALVADGRGKVHLNIKIQFILNQKVVVVGGEVRAVSYDEETNSSVLHIQTDAEMPFEMKSQILAYIYDIKMPIN